MMNKKLVILIAAIFIIAAAGFAWWQYKPLPASKYTGPVETIRFASSASVPDLSTLIWIADKNGYFKNQGLNVVISQELNGVIAQEKVASGDYDMAVDSDFGFVGDSFTLNNLRILASIDQANILDIVAKKDSGINAPADLIGKKIGVPLKLAPEFFLNQFLISNNISPSQVSIVNIPVSDEQEAITSGKVDAVSAPNPTSYNIKTALGSNAIYWSAQGNQNFSWFVISSDQFLKDNPNVAERFIKSLLAAEDFVRNYPEESKKIVEDKFAFSQEYFNQIWPRHQFNIELTQSSLINMESEARWVITNKLTNQTEVPNYLDFIYFPAMEKVKPEAVTIIH